MGSHLRGIARLLLIVSIPAALLAWGGCILRTPNLLKAVNGSPQAPGPTPTPLPSREPAERVARILRAHLVDSYADPASVAKWLGAVCEHPEPIIDLLVKTSGPVGISDPGKFYAAFEDEVSPKLRQNGAEIVEDHPSPWGIPRAPLRVSSAGTVSLGPLLDADANPEAVKAELDAERFIANARPIASSLLVLQNLIGRGPFREQELREGICRGASRVASYLNARRWRRQLNRPTTALVMSGGAANGAFLAGFAWRLTEILQHCHASSRCPEAGLDLIVGTSSGSLVGVTADIFATRGTEQQGRDLMLRNYTCSAESDLYCVNDVWDWQLLTNTRGLVRFDGIRQKLDGMLTDAVEQNSTELVTMSVDYESGDLMAESDQDPEDGQQHADRVNAVLASIVEPVMADPIDELGRPKGGKQLGTFIDGGVRSETPALEAVRRGAERMIVVSSSGLQPEAEAKQRNAGAMLMRTIDLLVDQISMTEIQQADLYATARRLGEFNICSDRLKLATDSDSARRFCTRETLPFPSNVKDKAAISAAPFTGPETFEQVSRSWRAEWVARPEGKVPSASGYAFDPELMRTLFRVGVGTFQSRCEESLTLLGISSDVQKTECSAEETAATLKRANDQIEKCQWSRKKVEPCKSR
jgi:predicted acylesterase/phospholipase RssA